MPTFQEPIDRVLRDFCHVEWYEVDELATLVRSGAAKFEVPVLRRQFEALLRESRGIAQYVNKLTANEFESDDEAYKWLEQIYKAVFF